MHLAQHVLDSFTVMPLPRSLCPLSLSCCYHCYCYRYLTATVAVASTIAVVITTVDVLGEERIFGALFRVLPSGFCKAASATSIAHFCYNVSGNTKEMMLESAVHLQRFSPCKVSFLM